MTQYIGLRLAIRREGASVNAYLATTESMKDARFLGSIAFDVAQREEYFDAWKALMTKVMTDAVQFVFGETPTVSEQKAPEHERSGNT